MSKIEDRSVLNEVELQILATSVDADQSARRSKGKLSQLKTLRSDLKSLENSKAGIGKGLNERPLATFDMGEDHERK